MAEGSNLRGLFEGMTSHHPHTMEPMAGIATHYQVSGDRMRITMYLRGHPRPQGIALRNTTTLRSEFLSGSLAVDLARGRESPPDRLPAGWSDGAPITAFDIVYSWRRVLD